MTVADAPARFCGACGGRHTLGARFCPRCGAPVGDRPDAPAIQRPPPPAAAVPAANPSSFAPPDSPPSAAAPNDAETAPLFGVRARRPARKGVSTTRVAAGITATLLTVVGIWWAMTGSPEWYRHPMGPPSSVIAPPPVAMTPADTPTAPAASRGYADPAIYCQVVGTADQPDQRYTGPTVPDAVSLALGLAPGTGGSVWRCRDGRVLACARGDTAERCRKFDLSATPSPAIAAYCGQNPDAREVDPEGVPGTSAYAWGCYQGAPVARRQVRFPDADGYDASEWISAL